MRAWRALARPYRTELLALAGMTGVMVLVAGGAVLRFASFDIPTECFRDGSTDACLAIAGRIEEHGRTIEAIWAPAYVATLAVPLLAAIVLGTAMLAREIEQQTTVLAWSLAPSRIGWLLRRTALVGSVLVVVGLLSGALGDGLVGAYDRGVDPWRNFSRLGSRGPVVGAATLLAFVLMLHAGAVLGRQLPSVLLGVATIVAAFVLISPVADAWLRGDARVAVVADPAPLLGAHFIDSMVQTPDGEFIGWDEASHRYGDDVYGLVDQEGTGFRSAAVYVPGELYPVAVARLSGLLVGVALLAIGVTAAIVHRRRPY